MLLAAAIPAAAATGDHASPPRGNSPVFLDSGIDRPSGARIAIRTAAAPSLTAAVAQPAAAGSDEFPQTPAPPAAHGANAPAALMRDDAPGDAADSEQPADDGVMLPTIAEVGLSAMVLPVLSPVAPAAGTIPAAEPPHVVRSEWQGRPVATTSPKDGGGSIEPPGDGAGLQSPGDGAGLQSPGDGGRNAQAFERMDIHPPADRTDTASPLDAKAPRPRVSAAGPLAITKAATPSPAMNEAPPASSLPPANATALTSHSASLRPGLSAPAPVADASTAAPLSAPAAPAPPSTTAAATAQPDDTASAIAGPPGRQLSAQLPDTQPAGAQLVEASTQAAAESTATQPATLPVATPATARSDSPSTQLASGQPASGHAASAYAISAYARAEPPAQVASFVASLASNSNSAQRLTLRLDPIELGHIEVTIDRQHGMPAAITLSVERPETLLRLVRDQEQLSRALDRAGLTAGDRDLRFQLATRDTLRAGDADAPRPDIQQAQGQAPNQNQGGDTANGTMSQRQDGSPDPRPQNQGGQRSHPARPAAPAPEIAAPAAALPSRTQQLSGVDITA